MNSPFSGRRVLLVEDEMLVVWLLEDMLADLGLHGRWPASSVSQALAMIDTEVIDAVVLDVSLNGQVSYPIADALAARGVPFVFSTGYDKDTLLDGYRTFSVLQKPFHRSELSNTLAKLLTPTEAERRVSDSSPCGNAPLKRHRHAAAPSLDRERRQRPANRSEVSQMPTCGSLLICKSAIYDRHLGGSKPAEQNQDQHNDEHEAKTAAAVVSGPVEGAASEPAKATK
jgi:CheY-like chemotaxis protein